MKKIVTITIIALLIMTNVFGQGNKSIFFELGANGGGVSANFDSRFTKSEKGFGYRIGVGIIPGINAKDLNTGQSGIKTPTIFTIPIGINHLAGKAPHYFESGIGVDYLNVSGEWGILNSNVNVKGSTFLFVPSVGYRYAKTGKAFQARVVLSPLIGSGGTLFFGGVSLGFKF